MRLTRLLSVLGVGLLLMASVAIGCSAQKKPDMGQGTSQAPAPTAPAPNVPLPTNPTESNRLAESLASQALQVPGVDKATVVLTGSTAMTGLTLKDGVAPETVKNQVAQRIKAADNRVKNVLVSTDPKLNQTIMNISQGVAQGRPISAFSAEIKELTQRLSPTTN